MPASTLVRMLTCPKCGAAAGARCVNLLTGEVMSRSHVNRTAKAPCGSYGGYQQHVKASETPCDPCREANRRYMAEYRKTHERYRGRDIAALRVRREATRLLIERHRDEFRDLLASIQNGAAA